MQRLFRGATSRCLNAVVRPRLTRLVFDDLLRMQQAEFLAGATHAAQIVCDAISAASIGDEKLLRSLHDDELLEPSLLSAIAGKVADRRERLADARMTELRLESDVQLSDCAWLQHVRLIVGAQRSTFDISQSARLDVGEHLVVCGDRYSWEPPPFELAALHRLGCTVQCTVLFDRMAPLSGGGAPVVRHIFPHLPQNVTPQSFTFEASLGGSSEPLTGAAAVQEQLAFRIVDINHLARGDIAFWGGADAVDPVRLIFSSSSDVS